MPARAAACGPATDVAAIEKLTIKTHNEQPASKTQRIPQIDETYIYQVDAHGDYDYSMIAGPWGMGTHYWYRDAGGWHYVPDGPLASWPANVRRTSITISTISSTAKKLASIRTIRTGQKGNSPAVRADARRRR